MELIAFMRTFFAIFEVKLHLSFLPKVLKPALAKLTAELISETSLLSLAIPALIYA